MPHQLFIRPEAHHADSHGDYLKPFELVRGELVSFGLWVKNIAADPFPGGTVKMMEFHFGEQQSIYTTYETKIEIKALQPQEQSETEKKLDMIPTADGPVWLQIRIESNDGDDIEFYQVEDEPSLGTEEWFGTLYVINRERLAMVDFLKKLSAEKGE